MCKMPFDLALKRFLSGDLYNKEHYHKLGNLNKVKSKVSDFLCFVPTGLRVPEVFPGLQIQLDLQFPLGCRAQLGQRASEVQVVWPGGFQKQNHVLWTHETMQSGTK